MPKIRDPPDINLDEGFEQDNTSEDMEYADLLEDLISLSERKEISHSVKYLKNATLQQLRTIKHKYEKKQTEETNKIFSEVLISQYTQLLESMDAIGSSAELKEELLKDKLLQRELTRILGMITPHVPFVGLVSGGITSMKHMAKHKFSEPDTGPQPPPNSPSE